MAGDFFYFLSRNTLNLYVKMRSGSLSESALLLRKPQKDEYQRLVDSKIVRLLRVLVTIINMRWI